MPIFEYRCNDCKNKFDVLHKSINNIKEVACPECNSENVNKLLSAFSAKIPGEVSHTFDGCADGSCNVQQPAGGGCASGMCGLN